MFVLTRRFIEKHQRKFIDVHVYVLTIVNIPITQAPRYNKMTTTKVNNNTAPAAAVKVSKWYFGGLASAGAACCTHPLDLIKVHFQTASAAAASGGPNSAIATRPTMLKTAVRIVKADGVFALYSGLTASLLRQLTYSTTRFGMYEVAKQQVAPNGEQIPLVQRVLLAGVSGAAGGLVGTPADMVNVRMQNDIKLPAGQRRNYKNAIDGLIRVGREEGFRGLFKGTTMATSRAIMMSIGQVKRCCCRCSITNALTFHQTALNV